jgi:hypothetical protein
MGPAAALCVLVLLVLQAAAAPVACLCLLPSSCLTSRKLSLLFRSDLVLRLSTEASSMK